MKTRAYSYIRFSTPEQIKGDSLRRQKERSEAYAKKHNLELDYSLKLEDLGISAFKGKNAIEGALSGFLKAVETKKVKKGSYLLIESLDRLSRDKMTMALSRFIDLINAGITIVTLIDEAIYNKETIDNKTEKIITAIVVLMRAHEESATKSERVSRAWDQKRKKASEELKPLTKRCPAWLELKDGKYKKIEERVSIIKRIYKLAIDGLGKRSIAKLLNSDGIDTWGDGINKSRKSNGWHDSYIQKILSNESVIGRYRLHIMDKNSGKRVPTGEIIENYYPKVISELEWNKLRNRTPSPRGKKGTKGNLSNLFTGIVYDGYTQAVMRFVNKGTTRGHGKYLSSDISRISPNTKGQNWSYHHFESAILNFMIGFDWSSLSRQGVKEKLEEFLEEQAKLKNSIKLEEEKITRLLNDFNETDVKESSAFKAAIIKLNKKIKDLESDLTSKTIQINSIQDTMDSFTEGVEEFKKLCTSSKLEERIKLQGEIRRRIRKISLYRNGNLPKKYYKWLSKYHKNNSYIVIEYKDVGLSILSFNKIVPMKQTLIRKGLPKMRNRKSVSDLIEDRKVPNLETIEETKVKGWESVIKEGYSHEFYQ